MQTCVNAAPVNSFRTTCSCEALVLGSTVRRRYKHVAIAVPRGVVADYLQVLTWRVRRYRCCAVVPCM